MSITYGHILAADPSGSATLGVSPQVAESVVKATCVLHNFLRWGDSTEAPTGPAEPSAGIQNIARVGSNNASREAITVRTKFTEYFSSGAGQVPWQNRPLHIPHSPQ